jgi:hypothetical protein
MTRERWRGLKAIAQDAVHHGSRAVERAQLRSARLPFAILQALPHVGPACRAVHVIHDASIAAVHVAIRLANRLAGLGLDLALDPPRTR